MKVTYKTDSIERRDSVPHCEYNLAPEDSKRKVQAFLTCCIKLGVLKAVFIVCVLFKYVLEQATPTRPKCVVEHGQPIGEVDLPRIPIIQCEIYLCEHEHNILVKVKANH